MTPSPTTTGKTARTARRIDPGDLLTLATRLFSGLLLAGITIAYALRRDITPTLVFGFISFLVQLSAIRLLRRIRADHAALAAERDAAAAAAASVPEGTPAP